jgi:hypothetical protein
MSSFTKLHDSILTSTIWREDPATKVVWVTFLAMADQDGIVESTIPGLAAMANVTIAEAETAIQKFLSPDRYSRTPDFGGRRVETTEGGWRLLNYEKYRAKLSLEYRRERDRLRQQRHRRAGGAPGDDGGVSDRDNSVTVTPSHKKSHQADTDAEADADQTLKTFAHSGNEPLLTGGTDSDRKTEKQVSNQKKPAAVNRAFLAADLYKRYPRKVGKANAEKSFAKAITTVAKRGRTDEHPDFSGDEAKAHQWLADRVDLYANSEQGKQPDKSLIPYPATWANAGRYDDDDTEWNCPATQRKMSASSSRTISPTANYLDGDSTINSHTPVWMTGGRVHEQ